MHVDLDNYYQAANRDITLSAKIIGEQIQLIKNELGAFSVTEKRKLHRIENEINTIESTVLTFNELINSIKNPYEDIEEETKQNDFWRQKINPRKIPKEYFDLGGEADGQSIEGQLHGPDNVPGPAYIDPGNPASSPSMAISNGEDLNDKFSWEETYDKNVDDGNAWKNRIPNR
jgi:hypothetical protein